MDCEAYYRASAESMVAAMVDVIARVTVSNRRSRINIGLPINRDAWAIAQICGRDDRLSVEQVRAIRELATLHSAETIAEQIGARNREQVQRVIDGQTYTRVV